MATHSSLLAWRIPGMGSHRVGHDWSDLAVAHMMSAYGAHMLLYLICSLETKLCVLGGGGETLNPNVITPFFWQRKTPESHILPRVTQLVMSGGRAGLPDFYPVSFLLEYSESKDRLGHVRACWHPVAEDGRITGQEAWKVRNQYIKDLSVLVFLMPRKKKLNFVRAVRFSFCTSFPFPLLLVHTVLESLLEGPDFVPLCESVVQKTAFWGPVIWLPLFQVPEYSGEQSRQGSRLHTAYVLVNETRQKEIDYKL